MMQWIGEVSLILALLFSFTQSVLPLVGFYRHHPYLLACARPSAWGQWACVVIAYVALTIAFCTSDFSLAYVAENSHPSLPFMYRLTAVWGAHEGSILLWILMLTSWTVVFSILQKKTNATLSLAVLGSISFCFLCFLLLTSNPFLPATFPQSGHDLNPLLQDPGFVIHPPMLYAGYVGFSVAFAITQAALIRGKLDQAWAQLTRRFALAAWCFLTLGIALGSWWAYRVLGWGGFWFWDPVENASLLPWLSGTALIHVLLLVEKHEQAKGWAALLAIISFAMSLLGTFLVRSGVLISAHTFASDPARGVFLLFLLAVLSTAALAIYIVRIPQFTTSHQQAPAFFSRETSLLLNSALFFVAMATILLGTLYPLLLDALQLGTISVGAPYFNTVMLPIVLVAMLFMGLAALCPWQHSASGFSTKLMWQQAWRKMLISSVAAAAVLWGVTGQLSLLTMLSMSLSIWIIVSLSRSLRIHPGMTLAHGGFAIVIIGIMLSTSLNEERDVRIKPGNAVTIGSYQFFFLDVTGIHGSNYRGVRAAFDVIKNTRHITNLYPEKRIYTVRDMVMTNVAIHPGIFRDLYIALGEPLDEEWWSVRLYYKPFVRWIWLGSIIMILGGIAAILQKKWRYAGKK